MTFTPLSRLHHSAAVSVCVCATMCPSSICLMHLKCFLGHLSYPIFEHGLHGNPFTSIITGLFSVSLPRYGYIPNSGTVFPQTEITFLWNAAAICISPV